MMCFSCLSMRKASSSASKTDQIEEDISAISNLHRFSYKELQIATRDFNKANKVGEGGYGSVFKGTLQDGTAVAIKVLSAISSQGTKEFLTELELITNIEHENLVKLRGCCVEGDHRIIVYGYLENNSLAQTLLGENSSNIQFDWSTRHKISVGVARGLAFLHEEVHPHIIHRDIKASNILLDKDLTPKISDFGLAKLFPDHLTHVTTRVAGTVGYLAPEYAIQGKLTRMADTYGFGVLLLEIVSGRRNIDTALPRAEWYLLERAWELHLIGELHTLVDASLQGIFIENEACRFFKVGLLCTQSKPNLRPSMSSVVKMLTGDINVDDKKRMITQPGFLAEMKLSNKSVQLGTSSTSEDYPESSSVGTMTFSSMFSRN